MPLDIEHFSKFRPYLYHLTRRRNFPHIRADMALKSAITLKTEAGHILGNGVVRRGYQPLTIGTREIELQDQDPLYEGNIDFQAGYIFSDFLKDLDQRVFFWPGWNHGPINAGMNHYRRYSKQNPVIIRVQIGEVLEVNNVEPMFCHYNSGAPRCIPKTRKGSPRGPDTFLVSRKFDFGPSGVTEVTFASVVRLPTSAQAALSPGGPWTLLSNLNLD